MFTPSGAHQYALSVLHTAIAAAAHHPLYADAISFAFSCGFGGPAVTILCAVLARAAHVNWIPIVVYAALGNSVNDTFWYLTGSGIRFFRGRKLAQTGEVYLDRPLLQLLAAKVVPFGVGIPVLMEWGASLKQSYRQFICLSVAISVCQALILGYVGEKAQLLWLHLSTFERFASGVPAGAFLFWLMYKELIKKLLQKTQTVWLFARK